MFRCRFLFTSPSLKILFETDKGSRICSSKRSCSLISHKLPSALRAKKDKSARNETIYFSDSKRVHVSGGKGGDGCISFLQLWCNERAGPDGGDGGNGGHVVFQASTDVRNFNHVSNKQIGIDGENGRNKSSHGKNAQHKIVKVPIGTVVRNDKGQVVGDLNIEQSMFVAARGGAGGKGNSFFATAVENSPKVSEFGPAGESITYMLELKSIADIGFIGYPNAGKSTLLNALTRAKPKVASYAFTTLRPYIGVVQYDDFTQITLADLPGLIPDSHRNKGLGIKFLKHVERCKVLLFVLDASSDSPWESYMQLLHELQQFNVKLTQRPRIIVANKMDIPNAQNNVKELEAKINSKVIPISAKTGYNLTKLLSTMREYIDRYK